MISVRPALAWEHVGVHLQGRVVLDDVSFAVAAGQILALLGANGAGKSSALLAAVGVRRLAAGSVRLDGAPLPTKGPGLAAWRQAVGLVSQHPADQLLAPSVCEDVGFGPHQAGLAPDDVSTRIDEALARAGAESLHDRAPHELSSGEQRRVALAGVLALRPRVLLLDEPTADLDAAGAGQVTALIRRLADDGLAIVLATHDTDTALALADDAVVLEGGRVLAAGPAPRLLHDAALTRRAALRAPAAAEVLAAAGLGASPTPAAPEPRTVADAVGLLLTPPFAWQP